MERFRLDKSKTRQGWWICTDTDNLLVCEFKEHEYNETQKMTLLDDSPWQPMDASTAVKIAKIAREMADWLRDNHYDIVF